MPYTYILECSDGTYYTGSTKYLEKRIAKHNEGYGAKYTRGRLPVKLIYFEEYNDIGKALLREKQIQGWSKKKKKILIENNFKGNDDAINFKNNKELIFFYIY